MERYWDSLNKAAILVTIITGIPALFTFIGMPFVAAVALSVLSISSLVFALVRSRYLREKMERTEKLHENDSKLLERANSLILNFNPAREYDRNEMRNILNESLNTLKDLAQELCGCEARLSLFTMDKELRAISIFSSTINLQRSIIFDIKKNFVMGQIFDGFTNPTAVYVDRSGDFYRLRPESKLKFKTIAVFPIYSKSRIEGGVNTWAGFLSLDLKKRLDLPSELKVKLLKYTHMYFLILHAAGTSVLQQFAQQQ